MGPPGMPPKFYCDYCDTYLTHNTPSVRKTHCAGRKHKENVKFYYQKWMEDQAQSLIDATTAAFMSGKLGKHHGNATRDGSSWWHEDANASWHGSSWNGSPWNGT